MKVLIFLLFLIAAARALDNGLAFTPPMGWMSWEVFRCEIDCTTNPNTCINEALYQQQTDALVSGGYLAAGYNGIHMDDCWEQQNPPRDANGHLQANTTRFPNGMKGLGQYIHSKGVSYAIYTAESRSTCGGYPASEGYEAVDAQTFADWEVDYVKVDGCGSAAYYPTGYPLMGASLNNTGRDIIYSCSWPAYLGSDETTKTSCYQSMIESGCNLWRNWDDIQCDWGSLSSIIDHYGDYGSYLQQWAAPGHWNDPDMLLLGNDCINDDEARTQFAIWSILAAPLIMGNDLRKVVPSHQSILLNKEAIAVDQDPLGKQGLRISPKGPSEIWARDLQNGDIAVGLFNKDGTLSPPTPCTSWNTTTGGYLESCQGNTECFSGVSVENAETDCCNNPECAGFSYLKSDRSGCYKRDTGCGFVTNSAYVGYYKPQFTPPIAGPVNVTVQFNDLGLTGSVSIRDIWVQKDLGVFVDNYTAVDVPFHGTSFLRLTQV